MAVRVTHEQTQVARKAMLGPYLLFSFPEEFKQSGRSVVSRKESGLSVSLSISGYHNFRTGDHGNPIDYLMKYKRMSFQEAVLELCRFEEGHGGNTVEPGDDFSLPLKINSTLRVTKYLSERGIPENVTKGLLQKGILYEDERHNAVFVSPERNYCEIRGTCGIKFHGCRKKQRDNFWYMISADTPDMDVYICESAIDAISLYLLSQDNSSILLPAVNGPACFVSIGGTGNQAAIEHAMEKGYAVMAVDNDAAGDECRQRNKDRPGIYPEHKDWNEDLMAKAGLKVSTERHS